MIQKKPTYDVETSPLLLETPAVAAAWLFPAARVPVLALQSLNLLCKWGKLADSNGFQLDRQHNSIGPLVAH